MHEYEALYQRYRRYRLKKAIRRWGAIAAVAIVGLGTAVYFYLSALPKDLDAPTTKYSVTKSKIVAPKSANEPKQEEETNKSIRKKSTHAEVHKMQTYVKYDPKKNRIVPDFGFEKRLVPPPPKPLRLDDKELMRQETPESAEAKAKQQQNKTSQQKAVAQNQSASQAATQERPKRKLLIKAQQSDDLKALEVKFYADPTLGKALVIANMYYAKGDYENAGKWALRANSIDKKNEESWLLFAKSLAKRGERQKAVSILEIYAKQSGSKAAKELARKIRSGVFR